MKNLITILLLCAILTSCSTTYTGIYKVGLQEVECPKNIKEQFGETKIVNFQDKGETIYSYEDGFIKIVWLALSTEFSFSLTNLSEHSIKIIWDEAAFVNENGINQKVFHSGVKYIDRTNFQTPTTIVKGAVINDMVMPTDNAYLHTGEYVYWSERPLFKNTAYSIEELNTLKSSFVGKVVKILLPIKIEDTTNEYLFTFKIEDVRVKTEKNKEINDMFK